MPDDAFELIEKNGRVFYPLAETGTFRQIVSEVLGDGPPRPPSRLKVSFLFTSDAPLELTILTPEPHEVTLRPAPPRLPARLTGGAQHGRPPRVR